MFTVSDADCPHTSAGNISIEPKYNSVVNKEDCAYCCRTCRHDSGIFVCMSCFTGVCADHVGKHTSLHASHVLYTIVKELPEESKKEAITDVNQLGVVASKKYDYSVCCTQCRVKFNRVSPQILNSYNGILNAAVAGARAEEENYGGYAKPQCAHLICLAQQPSPFTKETPPTSDLQCGAPNCGCTVNNWMCMTCGCIGCPRAESGGNGHALTHFTETGHPCTVKLGTVTPAGADFYCYRCDDDVSDVHFATHMAHFGIDVNTAKKTAKTMGEMMYDISSKFDFNQITEAGENLEPIYGPGRTGIVNIGNTCYIASVLQCLLRIPSFQSTFYNERSCKHQSACKADPYACRTCQTERVASGLLSGEFSRSENEEARLNGIGIRNFKSVFAQKHPEFSTGSQQDASEFFLYLLEEFSRFVKPFDGNLTVYHQFEYLIERRVQCSACKKVRYTREKENLLSLSVPLDPMQIPPVDETKPVESQRPRTNLEACLRHFTVGDDIECTCASCGQKCTYLQSTKLASFPDTLVIAVKRAYFDPRELSVKKMDVYVDVPEEIDLDKFRATGKQAGEEEMKEGTTPGQSNRAAVSSAEKPVDEVALVTLISMGIDMEVAKYALLRTDMNVDRAVDYIFSHPNIQAEVEAQSNGGAPAPTAPDTQQKASTDGSSHYKLFGMVSHIGSSAKTGHYVSHIKDAATDKWVLFNDEKVGVSINPPLSMAAMYFFRRS